MAVRAYHQTLQVRDIDDRCMPFLAKATSRNWDWLASMSHPSHAAIVTAQERRNRMLRPAGAWLQLAFRKRIMTIAHPSTMP